MVCDGMIADDLAERQPILYDRVTSWEERNKAEHGVTKMLAAIGEHPAVAAIEDSNYRLINFAEYRLRLEIAKLLLGWTLARAGADAGARQMICDPVLPMAFVMGARAGLGLDPGATTYTVPPALPGSRYRRAVARHLMRGAAAISRPENVRVAAVAAGKLVLALGALSDLDLSEAGVGLVPFPGLDHGNGLLLSLRRRIPLVMSYRPLRSGSGVPVRLPVNLDLVRTVALDRALTILVERVLAGTSDELNQAVKSLDGMARMPGLRAVLLPSAAFGASRLLIEWAHRRDLCVAAVQHGVYGLREFDGGDRRADLIFAWGVGVAEQIRSMPDPQPAVHPVGVPGTLPVGPRSHGVTRSPVLRRALIATSSTLDAPIIPSAFCEAFIKVLAPGLERLAKARVEVELRPHPNEDPEYYRRLLRAHELDVKLAPDGPLPAAVAGADILISSVSSVAFEAATAGRPVLLWLGAAPRWVREEHLTAPWIECVSGMFETAEDFRSLVDELVERPAEGFQVAYELSRHLAHYAEPFDVARFGVALRDLGS
jgi:hypothetical protein